MGAGRVLPVECVCGLSRVQLCIYPYSSRPQGGALSTYAQLIPKCSSADRLCKPDRVPVL
jgi:hypothetical protein